MSIWGEITPASSHLCFCGSAAHTHTQICHRRKIEQRPVLLKSGEENDTKKKKEKISLIFDGCEVGGWVGTMRRGMRKRRRGAEMKKGHRAQMLR